MTWSCIGKDPGSLRLALPHPRRQKTPAVKVACSNQGCNAVWCAMCLWKRYSENIGEVGGPGFGVGLLRLFEVHCGARPHVHTA